MRREVRTRPASSSIWQTPLTEEAFRTTAVDLAIAAHECPVDADIGLQSPLSDISVLDSTSVTLNEDASKSHHVLPFAVEHRLANDFALIAATQEAVFSVTAGCIEEHLGVDGHLEGLTIRLAANEGISEPLKASLLDIWADLESRAPESDLSRAEHVFEKIIHLNRTRILQRVRKAVGHPPIFREKGRTRTNPDDRLLRALARMRKEKLTSLGHAFVNRATDLNVQLLHLLETVSVNDAEAATPEAMSKLQDISKRCFDVATMCGDRRRLPFKHLLQAAGLDQRTWLKNKHVVEIDKIGAYWRIARSLVHTHSAITTSRPLHAAPIRFSVEGVQPYVSVMQGPSIQGRDMACYIHAEVQLLTHYMLQDSQCPNPDPAPRVIGASKSACFLCFLFIACHGRLHSPATHGRLYDQWTIPDLEEYTTQQVDELHRTLVLMQDAMLRLRAAHTLKKVRDFPMTSRTDLDKLSIFTVESAHDDDDHGVPTVGGAEPEEREEQLPSATTPALPLRLAPSISASKDASEHHTTEPRTPSPAEKAPSLYTNTSASSTPACLTSLRIRIGKWLRKANRQP